MAVKTITIDIEAYELLARNKRQGQSFSQVIKAHFGEQPTAGRLLRRVRGLRFSQEAIDAVRKIVRDRQLEPARDPRDPKP